MRKVTLKASEAMRDGKNMVSGNTRVHSEGNVMELHGNTIAIYNREDGLVTLRDCNWTTVTTKERLNGIMEALGVQWRIKQENYNWILVNTEDGRRESWEGFIVAKVTA